MLHAETSLNESPIQRRAKIVATLGPASNTEPVFRELVRAGVDVVRLNFSHGSHDEKLELIQMIRKVSREERKPLCILGDLQGRAKPGHLVSAKLKVTRLATACASALAGLN